MTHKLMSGIALAVFGLAAPALGGIDFPPPWTGTGIQGQSTHWRWDFNQPNPGQPQGTGAGTPQFLPFTPGTNPGWLFPNPDGTQGPPNTVCIAPGGTIEILVPNFPRPNNFKYIWIQYHYYGGSEPQTGATSGGVIATPYGPTITPSDPDGNGPLTGLVGGHGWQFPFNPESEIIQIHNPNPTAPIYLEWLTIDTICAPSPGAAAMLAGAGLLTIGRRRR